MGNSWPHLAGELRRAFLTVVVEGCQAFSQCLSPSTNPPLRVLKVRLMETAGTDHFRDSQPSILLGKMLPNREQCPQVQKACGRIKLSSFIPWASY